jgi:transposase
LGYVPVVEEARVVTKKKSRHACERDTARVEKARAEFIQWAQGIEVERLKVVDESGINITLRSRLHGRAPRGKCVGEAVPRNYGENITIIGAMTLDGLKAVMTVDGATDADVFEAYVERVLVSELRAGDLVVWDNLGAHRGERIKQLIEGVGAQLKLLPPYSPDLSPIEGCWSKLKTILRGIGTRAREALEQAIREAIAAVSQKDAQG